MNKNIILKMVNFLPDIITGLRISLTPIIVLLYSFSSLQMLAWGLLLFAVFTDMIDGYLARLLNVTSKFGGLFDSYADKVLMVVMLFLNISMGKLDPMFGIIAAFLIILRELLIFLLRLLVFVQQISLGVLFVAKIKTFFQMMSVILLLYPVKNCSEIIEGVNIFSLLGIISLWIAAILSVYTGFKYVIATIDIYKKR